MLNYKRILKDIFLDMDLISVNFPLGMYYEMVERILKEITWCIELCTYSGEFYIDKAQ